MKWLAALPFVLILGGAFFFNDVTPFVLGLPLLLAWLVFCVVLTSAIMAAVYFVDPANRAPDDDPTAPADGRGSFRP